MRKNESVVQSEIRLRASELGIFLFRNNNGACEDKTGRIIRYGLANDSKIMNKKLKSSDLIGWLPTGKFLSIECKHSDWRMPPLSGGNERFRAQLAWIILVNKNGGVAGFANSVEAFERLLQGHM